ncbi:MAG: 2-succinyl-5-enolpyruvyl-6-hydroxy-3-cyclohexene-1-carboxylic-acid synthase [Calothrix sp. MO_192.B10]|nr:2-succinyl-5-enolpyruvyl-6-hydroxy-3-cyclohexene-1-carboxylic-acid synthase [Calothrix sp. MO_192.B10]
MTVDFSNINSVWASILVESLHRLGLTRAVICPGSRSTPLTFAFAQHNQIEAISMLDERSASFFALGLAKRSGLPVALVCTSGTACANFYPALIEARESRVPLILLTADRPQELRDCNAGQTIDQIKIFGNFPNWQSELALPSLEIEMLSYLRQIAVHAWEKSLWPISGPVHLNIPFREPLAPIPEAEVMTLMSQFKSDEFFTNIEQITFPNPPCSFPEINYFKKWEQSPRGVIIAGPTQHQYPEAYCRAIARISKSLGWPVLAEALSPLRNNAAVNDYLISSYDIILRNQTLAKQFAPEIAIRIGEMPTSKVLRTWLRETQPMCWIIDPGSRNLDPLHLKTIHLRLSVEKLSYEFSETENRNSDYLQLWCYAEKRVQQSVDKTMNQMDSLFEGKAAWLLSKSLPKGTPLFISNSTPIRDLESFWQSNDSQITPYFNRGANGIDGIVSTALGVAYCHQNGVLLTGDLALLHDINGLLLRNKFSGHLTIVLINNNGGGIFEHLPIVNFNPPFEEFFGTPQNIDFSKVCAAYDVEHELIGSWKELAQKLNPLPTKGIRVLELQTNRKTDAKWRKSNLTKIAEAI